MMKVDVVSVQNVDRGYNRRKESVEEREERERGEKEGGSERERMREREWGERENGVGERERGEKDRENLKIVGFTQLQLYFLTGKTFSRFLTNPFIRQRGQEFSLN